MNKVIDMNAPENIISGKIVDTAYYIHRKLGAGLLESAYEEAFCALLIKNHSFVVERQKPMPVFIDDIRIDVGFRPDIIVGDQVIVELKAVEKLLPIHEAQILTYMKFSNIKLGLLINFNVANFKDGIRRFIL